MTASNSRSLVWSARNSASSLTRPAIKVAYEFEPRRSASTRTSMGAEEQHDDRTKLASSSLKLNKDEYTPLETSNAGAHWS